MSFSLPSLEYDYSALEPFIDAKTMEIHHTKHHQAYIDKLNIALEKYPELSSKSVEELLFDFRNLPEDLKTAVRNHGGGHFNHSLFWQIMTPDEEKREFSDKISEAIVSEFGSFDEFKKKFSDLALGRFGSGWTWLVLNNGKLEILSSANQDCPITDGKIPLLAIDVWEHAYYLKHQSKRADYINDWWNVVNWAKVNELYGSN